MGLRSESMFQNNVLCHRNKMIASPDTSWLMCQHSLCTTLLKAGEEAGFQEHIEPRVLNVLPPEASEEKFH